MWFHWITSSNVSLSPFFLTEDPGLNRTHQTTNILEKLHFTKKRQIKPYHWHVREFLRQSAFHAIFLLYSILPAGLTRSPLYVSAHKARWKSLLWYPLFICIMLYQRIHIAHCIVSSARYLGWMYGTWKHIRHASSIFIYGKDRISILDKAVFSQDDTQCRKGPSKPNEQAF